MIDSRKNINTQQKQQISLAGNNNNNNNNNNNWGVVIKTTSTSLTHFLILKLLKIGSEVQKLNLIFSDSQATKDWFWSLETESEKYVCLLSKCDEGLFVWANVEWILFGQFRPSL